MGNPFYNQTPNNPMNGFINFMQSMRGQDPNKILTNLVNSGKVNQQQLNIAQQRAKQLSGAFDGLRSMFGF